MLPREIDQLISHFEGLSPAQISHQFGPLAGQADLIIPSLRLVSTILKLAPPVSKIHAPKTKLIDGVLASMADPVDQFATGKIYRPEQIPTP